MGVRAMPTGEVFKVKDGFLRVAAATPSIRVADTAGNVDAILELIRQAPEDTALLVFPELCLTGYTCGDLFWQPALLKAAEDGLRRLLDATVGVDALLVVGLPVSVGASLYNCAAVCQQGQSAGPDAQDSPAGLRRVLRAPPLHPRPGQPLTVEFAGQRTSLSADQLYACRDVPDFVLGVEICEDMWAAAQPSQKLAAAGATVIANLSASDESIGKGEYRRQLVASQSARLLCAYVYADAGEGGIHHRPGVFRP